MLTAAIGKPSGNRGFFVVGGRFANGTLTGVIPEHPRSSVPAPRAGPKPYPRRRAARKNGSTRRAPAPPKPCGSGRENIRDATTCRVRSARQSSTSTPGSHLQQQLRRMVEDEPGIGHDISPVLGLFSQLTIISLGWAGPGGHGGPSLGASGVCPSRQGPGSGQSVRPCLIPGFGNISLGWAEAGLRHGNLPGALTMGIHSISLGWAGPGHAHDMSPVVIVGIYNIPLPSPGPGGHGDRASNGGHSGASRTEATSSGPCALANRIAPARKRCGRR